MAGGEGEGRTGHRVQGERHNARRVSPPKPLTLNSKRKTYVGGVAGGAGIAGGAGAHMATATQKEQVAEQHSPQHASPSFCCAGGGARAPAAAAPLPPSFVCGKTVYEGFQQQDFPTQRHSNTEALASPPSPPRPSLPLLALGTAHARRSRAVEMRELAPRGLRSPALSLQTVRCAAAPFLYLSHAALARPSSSVAALWAHGPLTWLSSILSKYLARRTGMYVCMRVMKHVFDASKIK